MTLKTAPRWRLILNQTSFIFEDLALTIPVDIHKVAAIHGVDITEVNSRTFPRPEDFTHALFALPAETPSAYTLRLSPAYRSAQFTLDPLAEARASELPSDSPRFRIYVDKGESPERKRFSIAHELGHIILGHLEKSLDIQTEEKEANFFASHLLVPRAALMASPAGYSDPELVSSKFGVSYTAAAWAIGSMPLWLTHQNENNEIDLRILKTISQNSAPPSANREDLLRPLPPRQN